MIEHPASISALIWPTFTDFAAGCGCGCEAGRRMRRRIAPQHWAHVAAAGHRRGIAGVSHGWLAGRPESAPQGRAA